MNHRSLVFVYGTLRKGEVNHTLLTDAVCMEERCFTKGCLVDTGNGYPALIENAPGEVSGELYAVTDKQLQYINQLEGFFGEHYSNNLYERRKQTIHADGKTYEAYVYVFENSKNLPYIAGNDWCKYQQKTADDK